MTVPTFFPIKVDRIMVFVLRDQNGFSLPIVLAGLVVIGLVAQGAVSSTASKARREIDKQVAFEGAQLISALQSYQTTTPDFPALPNHIDQLLYDDRSAHLRHLRRPPRSPFSHTEWQQITGVDGTILGFFLDSDRVPMKRSYRSRGGELVEIETFRDWLFLVPLDDQNGALTFN